MSKATKDESNVDTRLGEETQGGGAKLADAMECRNLVNVTSIEGRRCEVNGGQE